jgi:rubredoxin/mono/diheme cytochrome c family protein
MARYVCAVCGYVHDEAAEGVAWSNLPADWTCPVCGAAKSQFAAESGARPQSDHVRRTPHLPRRSLVIGHRVFGYVFLSIYVVLLVQMIPRLWAYQIEFPARTVAHITLGMAIGVLLLLKIAIVRYFRRLDQALVPLLGSMLLVGSVVLIGISVPVAFREAWATGKLFAAENRQRVEALLAQAGLSEAQCTRYASAESLRAGQRVLRSECIDCHDLRTVLARPRTPLNWRQTVARMADRTTVMNPISESEQWQVTAYLVAISPQLQRSAQQRSEAASRSADARQAAQAVAQDEAEPAAYDAAAAQQLFSTKCALCHETSLVDMAPPASQQEAQELVVRMVDAGLEASEAEIAQLVQYLTATYASGKP